MRCTNGRFYITVHFTFRCAECGVVYPVMHRLDPGAEFLTPGLPDGWIELYGVPYCSAHKIDVKAKIDGHELITSDERIWGGKW